MAQNTTPVEEMTLLFDVWLVMHLASGMLDAALADDELSGDDFGLYSLLRVFGPVTPTQIARWTGMRPTTVSANLRRMSGRGHSTEYENPADGRSYLVGLSASGVAAHRRAASAFLDAMGKLDETLEPDLQRQRIALQRLDAALREACALDDRPYTITQATGPNGNELRYPGAPLTPREEDAVRGYIDFVRGTAAAAKLS